MWAALSAGIAACVVELYCQDTPMILDGKQWSDSPSDCQLQLALGMQNAIAIFKFVKGRGAQDGAMEGCEYGCGGMWKDVELQGKVK